MQALGNFSYYTFYSALWSPRELAREAVDQGYGVVGLADWNGFYGSVLLSQACQEFGLRPVHGCRLRLAGVGPVQLTVRDGEGYRGLCEALTRWNRALRDPGSGGRSARSHLAGSLPAVPIDAFGAFWEKHERGLLLSFPVATEPGDSPRHPTEAWKRRYAALCGCVGREAVWLELGWHHEEDHALQQRIYGGLAGTDGLLGEEHGVTKRRYRKPLGPRFIWMAGARMRRDDDFDTLHVLEAIGSLTLRGQDHPDKLPEGDYRLPDASAVRRRFLKAPRILRDTLAFAEAAQFDFEYGRLFMPHHQGVDGVGGETAGTDRGKGDDDRRLAWLCLRGLARNYDDRRYPWGGPDDRDPRDGERFRKPCRETLKARLRRELQIVRETGYAGYFLIFHDIIVACREREIPVLARGSAAGSLICYCLGVSNVCPFRFGLSFERFLNHERLKHSKLPDIDLDLPWDRRDELIAYVYEKFGEGHVAMIGGFATFKAKAAIAEIGKTLGMPDSVVRKWTRFLPQGSIAKFDARKANQVESRGLDQEEGFAEVVRFAGRLDGLPRHPMMHPCGIVVADRALTGFTPLEPSNKGFPMTQMAMEPIEDLGLLKLDLLGQAGLSVLRDAVANIREDAGRPVSAGGEEAGDPLKSIDYADTSVFELVRSGNARGVFHIESPAMTSLLRLCRCSDIDCLVATVSVIRPGAANEDKKRLFSRRYLRLEPPFYHHPDLEPILSESYGLMIYEEHILQVAHRWGGMDLGRADLLRRILIKKKDGEELEALGREFVRCARGKGYAPDEILRVWEMLVAFSGYMFNKAHGAAYAVEAFQGCWLKLKWPVHFLAAVLQNQRGFYSPLVYVLEAIRHGAVFRCPRVDRPVWAYTVTTGEDGTVAVDIPLWQVKGLSERFLGIWRAAINAAAKGHQDPFPDFAAFLARTDPTPDDLQRLARVGALDGYFSNRHEAVWQAALPREKGNSQAGLNLAVEEPRRRPALPLDSPGIRAKWEQELLGYPVSRSPYDLWMETLDREHTVPVRDLPEYVGREVEIAGLIVTTRNHMTVKGMPMKFVTLADETGFCETTLFPATYRTCGFVVSRSVALRARVLVEWDDTESGLSCEFLDVVGSVREPGLEG